MKRPNILFLMCDQMQGRVLEPNNPCITPNFDKLASRGVRLQRAYTTNAVCSPARASLMTGLLPHNHGVLWVTHTTDDDQSCLRTEKPHWAQSLVQAGYNTGYFGKWHVERSVELDNFGWNVNGSSDAYKNKKNESAAAVKAKPEYNLVKYLEHPEGYDSNTVLYGVVNDEPEKRGMGIDTSAAMKFMDEAMEADKPWCCFVSVKEPHDPYICGKKAYDMYDVDSMKLPPNAYDELIDRPNLYKKAAGIFNDMTDRQKKEAMACYYASITEIDGQFGRLIEKVEKAGQLENTIIILTSDHGDSLGARGLYCKNISATEEVYNIPMIIAGAGVKQGEVSTARVGLHDLCQTILELTGCDIFDVPDSKSFAKLLMNPEEEDINYQKGFAEYSGGRILLTQRVTWDGPWKFVFNGFDYDELYNLDEDPYEMNNLAGKPEYDEVLRRMAGQMWKIIKETGDHSLLKSDYPILRVASYGPRLCEV